MKRDSQVFGIFLGIVIPLVGLYFYALIAHDKPNPIEAVRFFIEAGVMTNLIKLAALVNLPFFFIFLNTNQYRTARGILTATILVALVVLFASFS